MKLNPLFLSVSLVFCSAISVMGQSSTTININSVSSSKPNIKTSKPYTLIPKKKNINNNKITTNGNELVTPYIVNFDSNGNTISSDSYSSLTLIRDYLNKKKNISLMRIEAHVGSEDGEGKNQDLSSQKAIAVARWLVKNGVDCKRLIAVGFGAINPVTSDNSSANNRISFFNASIKGKNISGIPIDGGGIAIKDLCNEINK